MSAFVNELLSGPAGQFASNYWPHLIGVILIAAWIWNGRNWLLQRWRALTGGQSQGVS